MSRAADTNQKEMGMIQWKSVSALRLTGALASIVAVATLVFFTPAAQAGPTDEMLAKYKEKFETKIQVQFLDTPLERVVESLKLASA